MCTKEDIFFWPCGGASRISQRHRQPWGANLLFGINFAENCMKMKKKKKWTEGGVEGGASIVPRMSPTVTYVHWYKFCFLTWIKQECIPVGCVPPAAVAVRGAWPVPPNFPLGCGTGPDPPQIPPWLWAWRPLPRTRHPPGPGTPPVDRILDTRFWKYYLAPNFVCGR